MTEAALAEPAARFPLGDHPLRRALTDELHLRRFPVFGLPATLLQIVMLSGEDGAAADRAAAEALCARFGVTPPPGRHFVSVFEPFQFVWERHTEFASYTFVRTGPADGSFVETLMPLVPRDWLASIPGQVVRATNIVVLDDAAPEPSAALVQSVFRLGDLVSFTVASGAARIWSDFRLHGDGFGRLLVHNRALPASDLARLVQQIQELGNYRNMALLGLPDAQAMAPELSALQARLVTLTDEIATAGGAADDDRLLADLSALSADLAHRTTRISYRMSATEAYAELAAERLRSIGGERIAGFPTLADFTERRLAPAIRTCRSLTRRLEDLSARTSWASSLLRTRVEITLERQSRDLLHSMNQRTDLQLRLQQTVEGLSAVAISYYAVSLLSYLAKALHDVDTRLDPTLVTALSVPVIVAVVAWSLHRMKRHLHHAPMAGGAKDR